MGLTPGTRLGAYEIVRPIGAGGMGEVYRARDTKLNRDVALKILPDAFADDADRLMRFTREAQVSYAVARDGQRFLMSRAGSGYEGSAPQSPIIVVLDWMRGMRK